MSQPVSHQHHSHLRRKDRGDGGDSRRQIFEPPPGIGILILPKIISRLKSPEPHPYKEHDFPPVHFEGGGEM